MLRKNHFAYYSIGTCLKETSKALITKTLSSADMQFGEIYLYKVINTNLDSLVYGKIAFLALIKRKQHLIFNKRGLFLSSNKRCKLLSAH